MSNRVSYTYIDKPLSGRTLFDEQPCHCEKYSKELKKLRKFKKSYRDAEKCKEKGAGDER